MAASPLQTRLRRIEGQVQGVQRMLEGNRDCEDVLTQLLSIRSTVEAACVLMTEQHLRDCVFGDAEDPASARVQEVMDAVRLLVRSGA